MAVFVVLSISYNPQARSIPLAVGGLTLLMLIIQFFGETVHAFGKRFPFLSQEGMFSGPTNIEDKQGEQEEKVNENAQWASVFVIILSIIGFIIILYYTNYIVAVFVFLFSVICFLGKEKPIKSFGIASTMSVFMYVLFDLLLNTRF